jgi:HEAT repeat protein
MERREVIAWLLAGASGLAAVATLAASPRPAPAPRAAAGADAPLERENRTLRATVVELRGESLALRAELDRLLARVRGGGEAAAAAASSGLEPPAAAGSSPAQQVTSLSGEIATLSQDMAKGGPDGMRALFQRISQLQAMGPEALPAMKQTFGETTDPTARRILASVIATRGGEAEQQFLLAAAERETDPAMKQALLADANMMGASGAERAREELRRMASSGDPASRASAIRGFADLSDPETASSVEAALGDPSDEVRLAALDALMRDPARRDAALQTAASDPSARIRAVAECRARLAELEAPGG